MIPSWKRALFLLPLAVAPGVLVMWPVAEVLVLAFKNQVTLFQIDRWVGLDNFRFLFQEDLRFWRALGNTLYFTFVSVGWELSLGLALALYLRFGRDPAWLKTVILFPWAIPNVVSARLWQWLFHPEAGLVNYLLMRLGVVESPVAWLSTPSGAMHAAILADVWKTTPLMCLLLYAGLQSVPVPLIQAARIDRTPPWRLFRRIILPLIRPALVAALVLRGLDAFRVFDLIYVMTGGGPAQATETLSVYAYKTYFQSLQFGYGSAIAVVQVGLMAVLTALALRWRYLRGMEP